MNNLLQSVQIISLHLYHALFLFFNSQRKCLHFQVLLMVSLASFIVKVLKKPIHFKDQNA